VRDATREEIYAGKPETGNTTPASSPQYLA
jgi:hypothetical protein